MSPLARATPADPKREVKICQRIEKTYQCGIFLFGVGHTFPPKKCFGVAGGANMAPGPSKSCFWKTRFAKVEYACFLKEYYMWRVQNHFLRMISAQQGLMFEHQDVQKCQELMRFQHLHSKS